VSRLSLAAGLLVGPVLLVACQTSPGAAAVVGNYTISQDQLVKTVNAAMLDSTFSSQVGDRASANRVELTRLIEQRLIDDLATTYHLSVTPAQVAQEEQALAAQIQSSRGVSLTSYYGAGGVPASDITSVIRSIELENLIGQHLTAGVPVSAATLRRLYLQNIGQFEKVHAAHILVASKSLAQSLLARVKANPASFASLARRYSTDPGSARNGGDLGTQSPAGYVTPFATAIETGKVGSFVLVHSQFGWHVIHIISRVVEQTLAQATAALRSQLLTSTEQSRFQSALADEARHIRVSVNPRFGVWQPSPQPQVVPGSNRISSPTPSPTGS
jgi:parvulin-like peptidyl-prolyl isomerase